MKKETKEMLEKIRPYLGTAPVAARRDLFFLILFFPKRKSRPVIDRIYAADKGGFILLRWASPDCTILKTIYRNVGLLELSKF